MTAIGHTAVDGACAYVQQRKGDGPRFHLMASERIDCSSMEDEYAAKAKT